MPPIASQNIRRAVEWSDAFDTIELSYDGRFLRRKVLTSAQGTPFLVDLAQATSLDHGDAFELEGGRLIAVVAAQEALLEVTGADLARIAWHIGNRHTPCQIDGDRLLIQRDHVIRNMLKLIDAEVREIVAAFRPEGGAYGHGRTHGHDHGHVHDHAK
jgi:urease accessory protein